MGAIEPSYPTNKTYLKACPATQLMVPDTYHKQQSVPEHLAADSPALAWEQQKLG